jgi:hypothetical protein
MLNISEPDVSARITKSPAGQPAKLPSHASMVYKSDEKNDAGSEELLNNVIRGGRGYAAVHSARPLRSPADRSRNENPVHGPRRIRHMSPNS